MPSTYSKKRKRGDGISAKETSAVNSRSGGRLKRCGETAENWNEALGKPIEIISQSTLPTKRTVLRRFRYIRTVSRDLPTGQVALMITNEVAKIWEKAGIPTTSRNNCYKLVMTVIKGWQKLNRTPRKRLSTKFQTSLDSLLDLAPKPKGRGGRKNEEKELEHMKNKTRELGKKRKKGFSVVKDKEDDESDWENDYNFYLDQRGERKASMGGVDAKLRSRRRKVQTITKPGQNVDEEPPNASSSLTTNVSDAEDHDLTCDKTRDETRDDREFQVKSKLVIKPGEPTDDIISLSFSRKDFLRETAEISARLHLSTRQQTAFTAKIIKAGGGSLKQVTISQSSAQRHRWSKVTELEGGIKDSFAQNIPDYIVMHWDSKEIHYEAGDTDERLCIKASFPGSDKSDQFCSAPAIPNGKGIPMAQIVYKTVEDWKIPAERIIAMSWDTTASNSGKHKGSGKIFEKLIQQPILWLGCRHHIGERHISHADTKVRGPTKGPTDPLFQSFKKKYSFIPRDDIRKWKWPHEKNMKPQNFLVYKASSVLEWAEDHLLKGSFGRDDYRELGELAVHYLGGTVVRPRKRGQPSFGFTMRKPGALHHARFLASALYLVKLAMLLDVLPPDMVDPTEETEIERMAQFICIFYMPYFLQARLSTAAPAQDLNLWIDMKVYCNYDADVADEVQKSILRQMWYLTAECVIFSLFDPNTPDEEKRQISQKLLSFPRPPTFRIGKPVFPVQVLTGNVNVSLSSFVGPRSWLAFQILHSDGAWLTQEPADWNSDEEYLRMEKILSSISVVNDTAERGVKDVEDYANSSKDSEHRGRIVLVSNSHRSRIPEFKKNEMENNI